MSTSQEVKVAADACAEAKSALAAAEALVNDRELAALALIPDEIAARDAANEAFNAALDTARASVNWGDAEAARQQAAVICGEAILALVDAAASYDQT